MTVKTTVTTGPGSPTAPPLPAELEDLLRRLRLRSLAAIRGTVEPVPPQAFARFLPSWQHVAGSAGGRPLEGIDGVLAAIEQLAGVPVLGQLPAGDDPP